MLRLLLLTVSLQCFPTTEVNAQEPPSSPAKEQALDNLLSERESLAAFETVSKKARESGIHEQVILEAKFLFHVDRDEDAAIAAMLPTFLKHNESFRIQDSAIFSVTEDWQAVVEYVQAIHHLLSGDRAGFKRHITEAFWLSPRQASAFAPHIERLRLSDAMLSVRLDFSSKFAPLNAGEPIALQALLKGKKAMLLHFWSPSSRECEESLPDFVITANALEQHGIAVVSLVAEDSHENLTTARKLVQSLGEKPAGTWIVDSKEMPLSRTLRLQAYPLFVLVSSDGSVLFNGEPSSKQFWDAAQKVNAAVVRPMIAPSAE